MARMSGQGKVMYYPEKGNVVYGGFALLLSMPEQKWLGKDPLLFSLNTNESVLHLGSCAANHW